MCVRESVCLCVRESVCLCVCERESVCVCVCVRERECVCVSERQNLILPSATCSWVNIFVDPGTTLLLTNQI